MFPIRQHSKPEVWVWNEAEKNIRLEFDLLKAADHCLVLEVCRKIFIDVKAQCCWNHPVLAYSTIFHMLWPLLEINEQFLIGDLTNALFA